jgi:hypothetical protein
MKTLLHYISLTLLVLTFFSLASCKQKSVDPKELYLQSLTCADTTYVLSQASACMEELKNGNLEQFVQMLATIDSTGAAVPLSTTKAQSMIHMYENMSITDYALNTYEFDAPDSNPIRYRVSFGKDPETGIALATGFALNAVKVGDSWVVTILDK